MTTNKPLIDEFWDAGPCYDHGCPIDFGDTAPKGKTQVFVMSPEVALAAEKLVRSSGFRFPALEDIHLPYEHLAVEYALSPEIHALRENGIAGVEPISKVGAYIHGTQSGAKIFSCTPYWQFADGRKQHSLFTFVFGIDNPPGATISLNTKNSFDGAVDAALFPCAAAIKGLKSANITPEMFAPVIQQADTQQHIRESAVEVPLLLFACSMLLSCKSGMSKTRVDARTPNISGLGARKRKLMSSSGYTVMHLSALESVHSDGGVESRVDTAAHYVRGHFKQRKGGIYWWNAFVRGTGELRKRAAYVVKD